MNIWTPVLMVFSLGLMTVNFFRFNILFIIASICINIGLAYVPGTPKWVIWAALLIAAGEVFAGFVKVVFGKSKKQRRKRIVG